MLMVFVVCVREVIECLIKGVLNWLSMLKILIVIESLLFLL